MSGLVATLDGTQDPGHGHCRGIGLLSFHCIQAYFQQCCPYGLKYDFLVTSSSLRECLFLPLVGNLAHPNLVAFQGYYWSSTMQLILSELIPNGNLFQHLHRHIYTGASTSSRRNDLDWSRRFQIALGTARAIAYLHHDCKPQVLHLNIKSTNILLDEVYDAKFSDYGLVKLLPMSDSYGLTKFHTAVGYVAPELACQSLRFSDKCDVYSFGIILLELVTGRKPVKSPTASEVMILCDFVRELLENGTASDCFDRSLRDSAENELIQVMKLGLICTSEAPLRRPNMAEVVQVLESIRSG
ncbi:hypothetical protein AQUCO_00600126v1 [Aquilegia coerulea]|uniref:Protein kinase domain-containing protein n=1 Tax=Aquilegia coerulea TaxID=218851 RepID=A0A2G5EN46_AQUCA|nr:hypothetical protein AQUCO_00600126v1 [Aquilegia coerulea]